MLNKKPQIEPAKIPHASTAAETTVQPSTKRGEDFGNVLLPNMTQFQLLARKVKQPTRLLYLTSHVCNATLPEPLIQQALTAKAALTPKQRTQLYQWLAKAEQQHLLTLEKISTRITVLTDTSGHQAVMAMLDRQDEDDMLALEEPTDKWSRALYLYNAQFLGDPQTDSVPDDRFEHAERRQSMNQHWNSKEYASHYLGPKDTEPLPLTQFEHVLREQVATLYPGIPPELIVISHHYSEDLSHNRRLGIDDYSGAVRIQRQHTIAATFNATRAQYRLVIGQSMHDAQVIEVDQPAAIEVVFSWECSSGMLAVFCPDIQHRAALASIFQQCVLGIDGFPSQVPMCSFDLESFGDAAVLKHLVSTLVEGVQDMEIQKIRLSNPIATERAQDQGRGRAATNSLQINRHSRDRRNIYQISHDVYHLPALEGKDISHVTLSLLMKDQVDCKAHRVAVHVARPNGLTHGCKSALDRKIVQDQLCASGIMNLAVR